jgi:hypothetical protein
MSSGGREEGANKNNENKGVGQSTLWNQNHARAFSSSAG